MILLMNIPMYYPIVTENLLKIKDNFNLLKFCKLRHWDSDVSFPLPERLCHVYNINKISEILSRAREIRCQFHQHFKHNFYARRSQKCQMTLLTWLSFLCIQGSTCVKAVRRTLMKLSPCVNQGFMFIAYTCA